VDGGVSFECGDTWVSWTYGAFSVCACICNLDLWVHGTLGSSNSIGTWRENPLVMPLHDSDISMNVALNSSCQNNVHQLHPACNKRELGAEDTPLVLKLTCAHGETTRIFNTTHRQEQWVYGNLKRRVRVTVNCSTDPHVPHGPRSCQPRGCHLCWS
jgi:hypothetical protein